MEVRFNADGARVAAVPANKPAERPSKVAEDKAVFAEAAALERALEDTPDVRVEEVERAQRAVGEPDYPPRETLRKIANLLAIEFSEP
jgi:hypothetical protein